jgi:archaemetzincin
VKEDRFPDLEKLLAPLSVRLPPPARGDWLWENHEVGQTFDAYRVLRPTRKSRRWHTLYLTVIGGLTPQQEGVLDATAHYLERFFDAPVRRREPVRLEDVPSHAQREHPFLGHRQLRSTTLLDEFLAADRPPDALACLAVTASDLWSEEGWNYVFGEAYYGSAAVWSMHRFGDPAEGPAAYRLCLQRSLSTASHETGHILGLEHCVEYECGMNGCNTLEESDRKPLHLCPSCLRKLCWNLKVDPRRYLGRMEEFLRAQGFSEEAGWYREAVAALSNGPG